ncbi:MAG: hypothetical protein DMG53_17130 [Acidobacteria bacterium]|nr:MAG: hypothetical protein DMG53_17130 [Acidobacteriota bacterium]
MCSLHFFSGHHFCYGPHFCAGHLLGSETVDDPQIEITLTTILAYGSYLLALHLHLSGVIATASAGLMLGNFGAKRGMSAGTRTAMESILGVHFVRHEFSRVSFDWPGNPCA